MYVSDWTVDVTVQKVSQLSTFVTVVRGTARMLLGLVVPLLGAAAYVDLGLVTQWQRQAALRVVRPSVGHRRVLSPPRLLQGFPEDGDDDDEGSGMPEEEVCTARRGVGAWARVTS